MQNQLEIYQGIMSLKITPYFLKIVNKALSAYAKSQEWLLCMIVYFIC